MGKTLYQSIFALLFFIATISPTYAAGEITLIEHEDTKDVNSIDENKKIGTIVARIAINGNNADLDKVYTLSLSDETHFGITHIDDDDNGTNSSYIISKTLRDYELHPHTYSFTIQATAPGENYTLPHTIALNPQNDIGAKTVSFTMPNLKEHYTFGINIATMQIDTNGVEWKTYDEYKVVDEDIPSTENIWWVGDITPPTKGTITNWTPEGTFTYDFPESGNEAVADSFYYTLYDSSTYETTRNEQVYMVKVQFKNISDEAPVATADTIVVDEAGTQTLLLNGTNSLLLNDSDLDNSLDYDGDGIIDTLDNHTVTLLETDPTEFGTLTLAEDGTFSYTHDGSNNFTDGFSYIINDGTFSDTTTVLIIVNPLNNNDPAIANDTIIVAEGGTATALKSGLTNILALASDADMPHDTLVITPLTAVATSCGSITINADGTFAYSHNGSEIFADAVQITITDEIGHATVATIPVIVTPVSDVAPIAIADAITVVEGGIATTLTSGAKSLLANDSDVENDINGIVIVTPPTVGTLTPNLTTGTFTYAHNGSETTSDSFVYYATDGTNNSLPVTVTITVTPNLAVTAPLTGTLYSAGCDLTLSGTVGISGSQITVTGTYSGIYGTVVATGNSWTLDVTPLAAYEGAETLMIVSTAVGTIPDTVLVPISFAHGAKPFSAAVLSVNEPVQFTDSSSALYAGVATHLWNFGDGTTSTLKDPNHLYALPGVYTVTEIITYYTGCSDTLQAQISVFNNISPTTENFFLDTNADGMMDRITLSFPAPITRTSLTGISFHFTWLSSAGTVVTLSPTINQWVFPTPAATTIHFDVPQGATADNVTSIQAGYGTGQLVSGARVETVLMKDGMAPVITYARIPQGLPNNLLLTYSEVINQPAVSPQVFDLLEERTNLPYSASLAQVDAVSADRMYALNLLTNAFRIKSGDRIWINPSAFISDLSGNVQANPLNDRVPIFVPKQQLTCTINGFSPVDPKVQDLTFVSANLHQAPPLVLSTGTAFDIRLSYAVENHNLGIKFVVMDMVGNVVCDIDKVGAYENQLFVTSSTVDATLVRVLWTGNNLNSRGVGGGTYVIVATVTDLTNGAQGQAETLIKVLQ